MYMWILFGGWHVIFLFFSFSLYIVVFVVVLNTTHDNDDGDEERLAILVSTIYQQPTILLDIF